MGRKLSDGDGKGKERVTCEEIGWSDGWGEGKERVRLG